MVDGRVPGGMTLEVVGEFSEKVLLVDKKDRGTVVEVPLQEAVLAVKRTTVRMSNMERGG
jgi:hypothetical protein